jgi:hypothetical protein
MFRLFSDYSLIAEVTVVGTSGNEPVGELTDFTAIW